jgi:hypothetical protein
VNTQHGNNRRCANPIQRGPIPQPPRRNTHKLTRQSAATPRVFHASPTLASYRSIRRGRCDRSKAVAPADGEYERDTTSLCGAKQLSSTAMHPWWKRCLERARVAHRPMHEARHTAITEFPRRSGNPKLTQSSPATPTPARLRTSNAHLDTTRRRYGAQRGDMTRRNRSDRTAPICGDDGGGGNRTRAGT